MDASLSQLVRERADNSCDYCRLSQRFSRITFPIDHIIARQHGGPTTEANLALACTICNRHKGPNIAGIDPETARLVRLFHPRIEAWTEHFRWDGLTVVGETDVARTTIAVLALNHLSQLAIRRALLNEKQFSGN